MEIKHNYFGYIKLNTLKTTRRSYFYFLILIITPKTNLFITQMSIGDLLKDDRYQIVRRLAKGGQGVVFLVDDLKTKEK